MSAWKRFDQSLEENFKQPVFSGLTAAFGTAAFALGPLIFAAGAASPYMTAAMTTIAGVNLFRERSLLSKAFSGASVASGVAAGVGYAEYIDASGWDGMTAYISTYAGMLATSTLNVAAHYTRNVGKDLSIDVKVKNKNEPDFVFKSSRTKNETQQTSESTVQPPEM